jgi:hypothetical protein
MRQKHCLEEIFKVMERNNLSKGNAMPNNSGVTTKITKKKHHLDYIH